MLSITVGIGCAVLEKKKKPHGLCLKGAYKGKREKERNINQATYKFNPSSPPPPPSVLSAIKGKVMVLKACNRKKKTSSGEKKQLKLLIMLKDFVD